MFAKQKRVENVTQILDFLPRTIHNKKANELITKFNKIAMDYEISRRTIAGLAPDETAIYLEKTNELLNKLEKELERAKIAKQLKY